MTSRGRRSPPRRGHRGYRFGWGTTALVLLPLVAGFLMTATPWRAPEQRTWAFDLVNAHGRPVSSTDFTSKHLLVYFGYTSCPDVCPVTLHAVAEMLDRLPATARASLIPIFISVDPERDTGARLEHYVGLFHSDILGLTGSREAIGAAADAYGVTFRKVGLPDHDESDDAYTVDHTSALFLITPDRHLALLLSSDLKPPVMAERIATYIADWRATGE